jgi:manganese/zinc/iron transport system substrate-binding protein
VRLWTRVSYVIRDTLMEMDPANAATFEANTAAYAAELEALHTYTLEQVERIPQELRVLVTAHDAFNYYRRAYGFQVEAVQGISTETEASAADVQSLADVVIQREVPAIFVETTISPRTIEAVIAAAQAGGQEVRIGGELFADAMGESGTPEGAYIGMMRHNIDTIVAALTQ